MFALRPDRPVAPEIVRLTAHQLALAADTLRRASDEGNRYTAMHEARRHLKKARALIRLARPALTARARRTDRQLRTAGRALAPLADAHAEAALVSALADRYPDPASRRMADVLRPLLDERRARIAADMDLRETAAMVAAQLDDLRAGVEGWHLTRRGFDAVAGGLRRTARLARRAAARALARPSGARFHTWRKRVKDLWLQVRVLQPRVGGRLTALEASLERLDGVLGQYHDCTLLRELLLERPRRFPPETAECLRLVRRAQVALRYEARLLAVDVHRLRSKALTAHVHALWRATQPQPALARETPCRAA